MIRMASVEQAQALLAEHGAARLAPAETLPLSAAAGRRLAEAVTSQVDQPPADVSAMDGYAVQFAAMAMGARLKIIGESRAGQPYAGAIARDEAVRIFTGAWIPDGCGHILIQEDARRDGDVVEVTDTQSAPANIRRRGRDFSAGAVLIPAGRDLTPGAIALAAAGNTASVSVRRRLRVGVLANGDELAPPGSNLRLGQIVNSIQPALLHLLERWGVEPVDLGCASDDEADVRRRIDADADVVVPIGGASVGDYDVVRSAFAASGFEPVFEKIAVKPGKPAWFSAKGETLALGLPGNPAAAMVTANLFLKPLLDAMTGALVEGAASSAHAARALPATGAREEYLRAILTIGADGRAMIAPAEDQDSSLINPFLSSNALIRRPVKAPAVPEGGLAEFIPLT